MKACSPHALHPHALFTRCRCCCCCGPHHAQGLLQERESALRVAAEGFEDEMQEEMEAARARAAGCDRQQGVIDGGCRM